MCVSMLRKKEEFIRIIDNFCFKIGGRLLKLRNTWATNSLGKRSFTDDYIAWGLEKNLPY